MSSPLDDLIDHVVATAETAAPGVVSGWIDKALEAGEAKIATLSPELQKVGKFVLDRLAAHKGDLVGVSQTAVVAVASKLALGQGEEAHRVWLATQATFDEQSAELDADADATQKEVADRSMAWTHVKTFCEDVLLAAGKAAIPLLLAL